jgi:hypothetical protein
LPAPEARANSSEWELLHLLMEAFPDIIPLETQLRSDPHLIWIKLGERRVINWLRQHLNERSGG